MARDIDSSSSLPRVLRRRQSTRYTVPSTSPDHPITPSPPTRKGSWISRPPRPERKQSCRRVNYKRRDWSNELEESEYSHLPFPVGIHDHERGGIPGCSVSRSVSFREDVRVLSRLDTSFVEQGLMIDVDEEVEIEPVSAVGTESSGSGTEGSKVSEWTALSEEAEGITMYFWEGYLLKGDFAAAGFMVLLRFSGHLSFAMTGNAEIGTIAGS